MLHIGNYLRCIPRLLALKELTYCFILTEIVVIQCSVVASISWGISNNIVINPPVFYPVKEVEGMFTSISVV